MEKYKQWAKDYANSMFDANKEKFSDFVEECRKISIGYQALCIGYEKRDEEINEEIATLKAKISQATTFIEGLRETPDFATIGNLRSFIDANYENIIK